MTVGASAHLLFPDMARPDYELGSKVAAALAVGSSWKHRKVESLRLLEGELGRRRVSLDFTPYGDATVGGDAEQPTWRIVPLTMLEKRPLRDFDLQDQDGRPLTVLGRTDDGFVAWSVLAERFRVDLGHDLGPDILQALYDVVHSPAPEAAKIADDLVDGTVQGASVLQAERLDRDTRNLAQDLARNFLLITLLPVDSCQRQIVKYSSHWQIDLPDELPTLVERFQVGLGLRALPLQLDVGGASDAASYHLEVHAVPGMLISHMSLPMGAGPSPFREDDQVGLIGHTVESYDVSPQEKAVLSLMVPRGGMRSVALFTTAFTTVVFALERLLPGAHEALLASSDGAAAVLLIIPAAYSLALSRPSENAVLSHLLWPLRLLTVVCIVLLLAGAASLVGVLHSPFTDVLWWSGSAVAATSLAIQCWAWLVSEARGTTW